MEERAAVSVIDSIRKAGSHYAAWLVDIWGVMHDGEHASASAVDACRAFRGQGGKVLLISNAPRPAHSVAAQLDGFSIPRDAYDGILSSGDLTRELVRETPGARIYHLGPERDRPVFDGLDITFADEGDADLIVCTGLFDDETETPDDYAAMLKRLAAREARMICANPDVQVERGSRLVWCAGALAKPYEELGGPVTYAGKPYRPIYDMAFRRIAELARREIATDQVLAIGDGVHTDIAGAANAGLDAVFIASGLHLRPGTDGQLNQRDLESLFRTGPRPIAAMRQLA